MRKIHALLLGIFCATGVHAMAKKNEWPKTYHLISIQNSIVTDAPFKVYPDTIEYVGKITIDENGELSCECLEDYEDDGYKEDQLRRLFKDMKRDGLYHIPGKNNNGPSYDFEENQKAKKQLWGDKYFLYEFERLPIESAYREYTMTINPVIGEKYLANKWQKEQIKGELVNAILHKEYVMIAPPGTVTPNKYEHSTTPAPIKETPPINTNYEEEEDLY